MSTRVPLYHRVLRWILTIEALLSWPAFLWMAIARDWTVFWLPLLFTAGAVVYRVGLRNTYGTEAGRPRPDYAAIARLEREVYGEAFRPPLA